MARIGKYKYKSSDLLGVGTVGTVYRTKDRKTGQLVAIKILLPQISIESNVAKRFEREMSILQKLNHPHIVRYLTDGNHNGQLYYVMELVDDGSLKDEMTIHGQLAWQQVCRYGIQICSALQHAHNHGIIHRDLKPANLFMTESGQLKLGDFGIARDTHRADLTDSGLTVGTYAYMAPEQIRADDNVTDKVDLYALGCLLYEMLTGRQPFEGANFAQIFDQHLQRDPPQARDLAPACPAQLEELIVELMAKEPDQRPFNARFVQGYLQELLEQADESSLQPAPQLAVSHTSHGATATAFETGLSRYAAVSWSKIVGLLLLVGLIIGAACLAQFVTT